MPSIDLPPRPLVLVVGPTAVGKTEVALQLAERLDGEIISADSRLFYRGMDIGTAKPTPAERARIPHHLIDVAEPDEVWSLATFQEKAHQAIAGIHQRNRLPFLVGGTGQYIRAVIEEWLPPRVKPNPALRLALERWAMAIGENGLHARLAALDPQAAQGIDPRNVRRTIRALEVILSTGQRFSAQRRRGQPRYAVLQVGLQRPRPELYARIDARIQAMLEAGLVAEVRGLLERGYSPDLPTLSAIGYREIIAHLQGKITLDEAVAQIKRHTRAFVRRQANWFKAGGGQPGSTPIHWLQAGPQALEAAEALIRDWLRAQYGA